MKKTKQISFMALFLIVAMILPLLPVNSFAIDATSEKLSKQNSEEVKIIAEDVNLRGEFEKHFILDDGTYLAVSYREAVHYLNDEKWEEIDNSLVYSEKKGKYENAKGVGEKISVGADSDGSFSAGIGDISWSWSVSSGNRTEGSVFTKKMASAQTAPKKSAVGMKVSALSQASLTDSVKTLKVGGAFVASNVDIECSVSKDKIKENLIINKKNSVDVLVMSINAEGYSPTLDDGKVTFISDEKDSEYFIDPPIMFDAAGESSCDIKTELYDLGSGKYALVYTPSEEWLTKAEYPVVFDPTVYNGSHYCNIEDTYVEEFVSWDMSSSLNLSLGRNSGPWRKAFIRINNLPGTGGLPIISAGINFKMTYAESALAGMNVVMSEVEFAQGTQISDIRYTTPFTEIQRIGSFSTVSPPTYMSYDLLTDRFIDNCTNGKSMTYALYIDESQQYAEGLMYIASSESSDPYDRPIFYMSYGYQRPENFISTSVSNIGSNRFFLKNNMDISSMSNRMIKTNGYSISTDAFNTGDPRGHFAFIGLSDSIKIYGCYDQVYVSASKDDEGYPFDGSTITGTSSSNATQWIIVQCGQFSYRIMPSCDLSLSLTMTENGSLRLEKYNKSKKSQTWTIFSSDSAANAGLNIQEGEYVINISALKTFLVGSGTNVLARSALKSSNEKTMKWKFQYVGDGYYIIESHIKKGRYLSVSSSGVKLKDASSISNDMLIKIESTTQGYYLSSKAGYYLAIDSGGAVRSLSYINTATCCMRLREFDNYRELNEVAEGYQIKAGTTKYVSQLFENSDFISDSDFSFSIPSTYSSVATVSSNGLISAHSSGTAILSLVHKPTNKSFTIIIVVPLKYLQNSNSEINNNLNRIAIRQYIQTYTVEYDPSDPSTMDSTYYNNAEYVNFSNENRDCANFVSQCLYAGGMQMDIPTDANDAEHKYNNINFWYYKESFGASFTHNLLSGDKGRKGVSYTWTVAENFRQHWGERSPNEIGKCYSYAEYTSENFSYALKSLKYDLKIGDIIIEMRNDSGNYVGKHAMIVSGFDSNGDVQISGHTNNRLDHLMSDLINDGSGYCVIRISK